MAKGFLKLPDMHMLIKQKSPSFSRNFGLRIFGELLTSVLNEGKSAISPLFNSPEVLSSTSDKTVIIVSQKTFLRTLTLMTRVSHCLFSF